MGALQLITAPVAEPLTLAEVKAHLRVDHNDEDDLILIYMLAAREWMEGPSGYLGRALAEQTWELTIDGFPSDNSEIKIPLPPLRNIESVKYDDSAGVEQTLDPTLYFVDTANEPGWLVTLDGVPWPTTMAGVNTVRIRFLAGYQSTANSPPDSPSDIAANIPFPIRAAMLLIIGTLYENREQIVVGTIAAKLPFAAETLLQGYRVQLGMA